MAPDFFRSAHLVYRRIPPSPKDPIMPVSNDVLSSIFTVLTFDPSRINASPALWDPPDPLSTPHQMRSWATSDMLLSVYICLPCSADTPGAVPDPAGPQAGPQAGPLPAQYIVPIGITHLSAARPAFSHQRKSRLGIVLASAHQGKGYGGEALRWIVDWGFRMAGLHRVELSCGAWNRGAARLYERTGFVREGVRRRSEWCVGRWRDGLDFGLVEDEFWGLDWVRGREEVKEVREWEGGEEGGVQDEKLVELLGCQ